MSEQVLLLLNTAVLDTAADLINDFDTTVVAETLECLEAFMDKEVLTILPVVSPRCLHRSRFADVLLGDFAQCIHDVHQRELAVRFVHKNLQKFSYEHLLAQFHSSLPFAVPISVGRYPLNSVPVTQQVSQTYVECIECMQQRLPELLDTFEEAFRPRAQKLFEVLTRDRVFAVVLKASLYRVAKNALSAQDVAGPAFQKLVAMQRDDLAQRLLQKQAVDTLKAWQASAEGIAACTAFKNSRRCVVVQEQMREGAPDLIEVKPPEETARFFRQQNDDDDEDAVVHTSDFSLGAQYGITDVSSIQFQFTLVGPRIGLFQAARSMQTFQLSIALLQQLATEGFAQLGGSFYYQQFQVPTALGAELYNYCVSCLFATIVPLEEMDTLLAPLVSVPQEELKQAILGNRAAENELVLDRVFPAYRLAFFGTNTFLELLVLLSQLRPHKSFLLLLLRSPVFAPGEPYVPIEEMPSSQHLQNGVNNILKILGAIEVLGDRNAAVELGVRPFGAEFLMSFASGPEDQQVEERLDVIKRVRTQIRGLVCDHAYNWNTLPFFIKGFDALVQK